MKNITKHLIALLLACGATATQAIIIDFEGLADGTILNSQFAGVTFTGAEVLDSSGPFGNPVNFPPNSGNNYVYDYLDGIIRADAASSWSMVGGYVTGSSEIFLEAYDSGGTLLGSQSTGGPNFDPVGTPNMFLSVNAPNIVYVLFHDSGNTFTLDDFTYQPSGGGGIPNVPDAGSTSLLLASSLLGLGLLRRKLGVS